MLCQISRNENTTGHAARETSGSGIRVMAALTMVTVASDSSVVRTSGV